MKKNDIISKIPNYLTLFRLILAPIIIILGITNHFVLLIVLIILASLTDFFDGYLARKWLVQSIKGAKLDSFVDKIFTTSIILSLSFRFPLLLIVLILEIIIALSNLYYYHKTNDFTTLMIGKIKTTLLFLLIITLFIMIAFNLKNQIFQALLYATINLQILTLASYYVHYKNNMFDIKKKKMAQKKDDLENKTIMLDKIEDLLKDYEKKDIL